MKIYGLIPARMAASRFPGKPLVSILGKPMVEHVYRRASQYSGWDELAIATCDLEISDFAASRNFPVIMTGSHHTRALDRVAEAATKLSRPVQDDDIIVCVQGDEPMMAPDMIDTVVAPLLKDSAIPATILAMAIQEEAIWRNPDTVKLIHNDQGEVLYTSRSPVPYCKGEFSEALGARRIYGIFAFRWKYLRAFTEHEETRLERLEACDSNRILDMNFRQFIAPYPFIRSYSVDSPSDIALVEAHMKQDRYWGTYSTNLTEQAGDL
jgi:3-deoxy-manno-octulosonate cytidylyltransferase (CMP-KDO synthetase)